MKRHPTLNTAGAETSVLRYRIKFSQHSEYIHKKNAPFVFRAINEQLQKYDIFCLNTVKVKACAA